MDFDFAKYAKEVFEKKLFQIEKIEQPIKQKSRLEEKKKTFTFKNGLYTMQYDPAFGICFRLRNILIDGSEIRDLLSDENVFGIVKKTDFEKQTKKIPKNLYTFNVNNLDPFPKIIYKFNVNKYRIKTNNINYIYPITSVRVFLRMEIDDDFIYEYKFSKDDKTKGVGIECDDVCTTIYFSLKLKTSAIDLNFYRKDSEKRATLIVVVCSNDKLYSLETDVFCFRGNK